MTEPRVLRLREHQTLRGVALAPGELAQLSTCGARLVITPVAAGIYDVTAAEMVGAIALRNLQLVIAPKVPVSRLLGLLLYATTAIDLRTAVAADEHDDFLSVMQRVYAVALAEALRGGLVHAYEERSDRLHAMRGRIDVGQVYLRRFGVFPPLDCTFDEYTADTEANRRLLAAAVMLARHRRGSPSSAALLSLASRMPEVTQVSYEGRTLRPLKLDRRWGHCRVALALADVVLRHGSVELADGVTRSLGLLVDMDRLFEDVVVEGLRDHLAREGKWSRQPAWLHLDVEDRVSIRPDVVWYRKGCPPLVLDAKYKATTDAKNADLYQVTAYCQAIGARRAVVVYADVEPRVLRVRRDGPVIELLHLDLDGDLDALRARLEDVAARVRADA